MPKDLMRKKIDIKKTQLEFLELKSEKKSKMDNSWKEICSRLDTSTAKIKDCDNKEI